MSDSDSDAPESIALSHSARAARGHEKALQEITLTKRRKTKERNRARDERLKAQAAAKRGISGLTAKRRKVEGVEDEGESEQDAETRRLQARMARAMTEASDEHDSQDEEGDASVILDEDAPAGTDESGWRDLLGKDDGDAMDEGSLGGEVAASDEDESNLLPVGSCHHLPDHVFAAAAAALPREFKRTRDDPQTSHVKLHRKRKRTSKRTKDIVTGSHAVRTLPTIHRTSAKTALSYTPATGATTAPSRINRFLTQSLDLRGQRKRAGQGWERKPVNVGLYKRNEGAPVSGFVRRP